MATSLTVAFLGLGRMGVLMAGHVVSAGHDVTVWNRTPGRAGVLVQAGAREAGDVRAAVEGAERIVLMLFGPDAVRDVLPEVVAAASPGALVVDSTTLGPDDAREFAETCRAAGLRYVDAPVAGSTGPAAAGTLGVLVGGSKRDYDDAVPLLQLWGAPEKVRRVGDVGAGSAMKLCNNLALGFTIAGIGEALRLGTDLGLERSAVLDVLGGGALGWMVGAKRPMLDADDYTGTTFSLELMAKDLALAVAAADGPLAVTEAVLAAARAAMEAGHTGEDFAAIAGHLAG